MARTIDFSKALDEDEQRYVADRPWLLQDARLRGEEVIFDESFAVEGSESSEDDETDSDEGTEDESEDEEGSEAEVAPYSEWAYADLKDEAKRRELSQAGSKEQLITRLEQDDISSPE